MKLTNFNYLFVVLFVFSNFLSAQSYREFIALHELYQNTNGAEWNTSWDFDEPIETWEGVTIKDGHVIALELSNNNLKGEIPMTLVNLRYLKKLNLSGNQLIGTLPSGMRKWQTLKSLNVANNSLSGAIPNGFSKMESLKYLQLADNNFEDYKGLQEIQKQQLVAFDMASDFKHLHLIDVNSTETLTNTRFEDIKDE